MKKIMFLIESLVVGGAEKVLIDMANNLNKDKYEVTVISIYNKSVYKDHQRQFDNLFANHIKYKFLCNVDNRRRYKMFNRLLYRLPVSLFYKIFFNEKYDIEIAFSEGLPTKIISGSDNKKSQKYAWLHTDTRNLIKEKNKKQVEELKGIYKNYNRIIAVSKSVANSFKNELDINRNIDVKYNPIDEKSIVLKSQEQIEDIKKSKVFTIVSVGRLIEVKGYDRLMRISKRLKEDGFIFKIWILGDGEQRFNLEQYVSENALEDFVKLLGFQSNPYKFMRQADLFICSSRAEGLSTVVTEAIILGKPVITTECAGMRELLGNNEFGIITENSEDGLYESLKSVLLNKGIYNYYKSQVKKRSDFFKINSLIESIEEIF